MHSSLIAVVLCISAQAAVACIPAADTARQDAAPTEAHAIKTQVASPASTGRRTDRHRRRRGNARRTLAAAHAAHQRAGQRRAPAPRRLGHAARRIGADVRHGAAALRRGQSMTPSTFGTRVERAIKWSAADDRRAFRAAARGPGGAGAHPGAGQLRRVRNRHGGADVRRLPVRRQFQLEPDAAAVGLGATTSASPSPGR